MYAGNPLPVDIGVQPEAQAYVGRPVRMHVFNDGTVSLRVTASPVLLHGQCVAVPSNMVHVTPLSFTVPPHGSHDFYATISGGGKQDYGVVFAGTAVGVPGQKPVSFSAAVGSQITTQGHLTCHRKLAPVADSPHSAGVPFMGWLAVVVIGLAACLSVWGYFLRRRHRA